MTAVNTTRKVRSCAPGATRVPAPTPFPWLLTLYEYDAFGNLVKQTLACDDEPSVLNSPVQEYAYGVENTEDGVYNSRSELIGDQLRPGGRFGYQYDNIGNRKTSFEFGDTTDYTTNDLNQYAGIVKNGDESFIPFYDEDGNQTKVKTSTGIWNVSYNAENRPVKFENGEGTTMYLNFSKSAPLGPMGDGRFSFGGRVNFSMNLIFAPNTSKFNVDVNGEYDIGISVSSIDKQINIRGMEARLRAGATVGDTAKIGIDGSVDIAKCPKRSITGRVYITGSVESYIILGAKASLKDS